MAKFQAKQGFAKNINAVIWIFMTLRTGVVSQTVTLTPEITDVIENGSLTLTCAYTGSGTVTSSRWTSSAASTNPIIVLLNTTCVAAGFLNNISLYGVECLGNNSFSLTLKKVLRGQHGDTWKCRQENIESNSVNIYVKVPVAEVEITSPGGTVTTIKENSTGVFTCTTSPSRPVSTFTWFLDKSKTNQSDIEINSTVSHSNTSNNEGLVSSTSTLTYRPNRKVNGLSLYCTASNLQKQRLESEKIFLNVTYPPDGPPAIQGFKNGSVYRVIEQKEGRLTCTVEGGNPLSSLYWQCFNRTWDVTVNDNIVKAEVTWYAIREYNASCICRASHFLSETESVAVDIEVLYSPTSPKIQVEQNISVPSSGMVEVIMNKSLTLYCDSSGNPHPNITWTWPDEKTILGQELQIANIHRTEEGLYTCFAENEMHGSSGDIENGKKTSHIDLSILYPPSRPAFRYGNITGSLIVSKSLNVVRGDTFTVTCTSSGNPEPKYKWNNQSIDNPFLVITSIATDMNRTCNASNVMNETAGEVRPGSAESSLSMSVLYPPNLPSLSFQYNGASHSVVSESIKVIENTSFTLTCEAVSKPTSSYSWYGPVTSTTSELTFQDIKRELKGSFACHAFNMMERSFGDTERGTNMTSAQLDVLYPPNIANINNETIVEGDTLNKSCPVIEGNPANHTVTWTTDGDSRVWTGQLLELMTTQKKDSMTYTCTVNNTMEPTFGTVQEGKSSRHFHLEILYKATVEDFYVKGHEGQYLTISENETVEFRCKADSNPVSTMSILFKEDIVTSQTNTFTLTYMRRQTGCLHAGVYTCTGQNAHNNGNPSKRYITLHVRCFPRASPDVKIRDTVFTAEHVPVVLSFTALAYPVPNPSKFRWRKFASSVWLPLTNNDNILIVTSGLQSILTIRNVTKADYGKYRLEIENDIGIFEQMFTVGPEETPYPPTEFEHIKDHTTESSVTLRWRPGLNGGPKQTFIIRYRKIEQHVWVNVSVPDSEEEFMNYTIVGLASGASYQFMIYSENRLGQSILSEKLIIRTTDIPSSDTEKEGLPVTAIIVGTVSAVFFVVIVTIVLIILKRKEYCHSRQDAATDHIHLSEYENMSDMHSDMPKPTSKTTEEAQKPEQEYDEIDLRDTVHEYKTITKPVPKRYLKGTNTDTKENEKKKDEINDKVNEHYENCRV